jgi:hypothetical protein
MSNYLREVLGAEKTFLNYNQPQGLVADAGPDLPGGEGANEGFWREQLRDRLGQFAKMLGTVLFDIEIEGLGRITGHGELVEIVRPQVGLVRIKNHPVLPDMDIEIPGENLEAIDGLIKDADYERVTGKTLPKSKSLELKDNLTGAEAQARKMSTVYKNLKDEGRFPVPRQSNTNFWGEESDIAKGAKEDYSLVYNKLKSTDPSWSEKYPTFDDFWGRVKQLSVGQTSQSPNDLSKIPQEMKDINKAYAENVLGLKPEGKITFYRNAVNQKGSPEDSALGYVTTNADFAYDYNSQRPNENGNGRYEIDAKPDEVFGMIGYSQLEDEFGVVIGRGVTSQPDRVRRVGDLAQPILAPWLEGYQDGVGRSTGGTPYRHYALAGQFDLLPVDPLGNDAAEFLQKHGKTAADIKAKFDELYGEGAYDDYKASDDTLAFSDIKRMFVDAGNGKVGLDITRVGGMDGFLAPSGYGDGNPNSYKNDKTDNTLKMLSVFQELSGQPFMVHRDHPKDDPRLEQVADAPSGYQGLVQEDIEKSAILAPGEAAGPAITPDLANVESGYLGRYFDDNAELVDIIDGQELVDFIFANKAKMLAVNARMGDYNQEGIYDDNKEYSPDDFRNIMYEQYKKVYDSLVAEDPEIAKKFPTFPNFNRYLSKISIDDQLLVRKEDAGGGGKSEIVPWESAFSEEDRAMQRRINRRFAELVLKLNPDGRITIYRNAVSYAFDYDSPESAAMGYWSYDKDFAHSFNPGTTRDSKWADPHVGRYSATIAVDDIVGIIGLMRGGPATDQLPQTDEMALSISGNEVASGTIKDLTFDGRIRSVVKSGGNGFAEEVTEGLTLGATPFRYRNMANIMFQGVAMDSSTLKEFEEALPSVVNKLRKDGALITRPDGTSVVNVNNMREYSDIDEIAKFQEATGKVVLVNNFNRSRDAINLEIETLRSPVTQNIVPITPSEVDSFASIPHVTLPEGVDLTPEEQNKFDSKAESLARLLDPSRPENWTSYNAVDDSKDFVLSRQANLIDSIRQEQLNIIKPAIDRKNEADNISADNKAEKLKRDIESFQNLADSNRAYAEELRSAGDLEFAEVIDNAVRTYEEQVKELQAGYDRNSNPGHEPIVDRVAIATETALEYDLGGSIVDLILNGSTKEEIESAIVESDLYKKREEIAKKYAEELEKYEAPTPPEGSGDFWSDPNYPSSQDVDNSGIRYALDKLFAEDNRLTPEENQTQREQALKGGGRPAKPKEKQEQERSTGLFNEYESERADQITAEDTRLTDLGWEPDEEITIYRGVPDDVDSINSGDWVTTLPQLAKDYAGAGGKVISSKVKARDLYADPSVGPEAYKEEMVYRPKAKVQPESTNEETTPTTPIDTTGTRLSSDSREGLDSLISNFNLIDNEAYSQAFRDIASELGRPLSLPWDDDRTPEGRETYEYIYSAKKFKKTIPENSEEAELIRIKNLYKENLENNKDLQEAKKTLSKNKLYKDLSDALNSEINDFDEDNISFGLMDAGRNLSRPRPRINEDEVEDFSITTPDFNDDEINSQVYDVTVDVEESADITNKDLKEFSETAAVTVILPTSALEEVLNNGRMKTVHETKYSLAGNSSEEYRALRVAYESLAFGYNGDSPMEERPVYGLLRSETLPMPEDALMIYGGRNPAQIILKPEAKSRTTISDRDSLNHFEPTTPLSDPKFEPSYITQMVAVYRKGTGENFFETENFAKYGSIEAQVHGGIKLDDIGKVLFYETPSEEIRELLTSKGIIWEVSRSKPYSKPRSYGGGMF